MLYWYKCREEESNIFFVTSYLIFELFTNFTHWLMTSFCLHIISLFHLGKVTVATKSMSYLDGRLVVEQYKRRTVNACYSMFKLEGGGGTLVLFVVRGRAIF